MALPTRNWTDIQDGQVDADSPLDTTLITSIRDNIENLKSQLTGESGTYTAAQEHDHDGVNSKEVASVADDAVTGAKIDKTPASTGSQAIPNGATWTPGAGVYQFVESGSSYCQFEIYVGGSWRRTNTPGDISGIKYCDGANMRVFSGGAGGSTVYYQTF
ncbi:MAG TPA: hypothetical protein VJM57_08935 [Thermodesulfobacteriota bacterium]|nr:hypothetical protein [Thermodesulfobacteriota bacterium]